MVPGRPRGGAGLAQEPVVHDQVDPARPEQLPGQCGGRRLAHEALELRKQRPDPEVLAIATVAALRGAGLEARARRCHVAVDAAAEQGEPVEIEDPTQRNDAVATEGLGVGWRDVRGGNRNGLVRAVHRHNLG